MLKFQKQKTVYVAIMLGSLMLRWILTICLKEMFYFGKQSISLKNLDKIRLTICDKYCNIATISGYYSLCFDISQHII